MGICKECLYPHQLPGQACLNCGNSSTTGSAARSRARDEIPEWYYLKIGFASDDTIGPLTVTQLKTLMIKDELSARTGVFHPRVTSGDWVKLADTPLITVLAAVEQQKRKEKEEARLAREEVRRQEAEKKEAARQKKRAEQEARREREAVSQRREKQFQQEEPADTDSFAYMLGEETAHAVFNLPFEMAQSVCFITTAVCEHEDLPDDCQTLTVLRGFRDNYMLATEERVSQVEKYYRIAPSLVERIDQHADRKGIYGHLRDSFILPAVEAVEAGDNQRAESIYTGMMNWLQARLA